MAKKLWIGFDLGGTKMLAVVFNNQFEKIGSNKRKTRGYEGQEKGVARMIKTIYSALEDAGESLEDVAGIGVGCPGPIDFDSGSLIEAPNMGWKNVPVTKLLKKEFGKPVFVNNDVDAGVFGEYTFGAGTGARTIIGIFPGTGIGSGCVYHGNILQGASTSCMELGHTPVGGDKTLEEVCSRLTIAAEAARAAYRGEAPHLLELAGTDLREIRSGVLKESIENGDVAVEEIVRKAARWIGRATGTLVNLLAPDVVVLGGGLVEALPDLYLEEVKAEAKKAAMPLYQKTFSVKLAELTDDATVLGAAAWAKQALSSDDESNPT